MPFRVVRALFAQAPSPRTILLRQKPQVGDMAIIEPYSLLHFDCGHSEPQQVTSSSSRRGRRVKSRETGARLSVGGSAPAGSSTPSDAFTTMVSESKKEGRNQSPASLNPGPYSMRFKSPRLNQQGERRALKKKKKEEPGLNSAERTRVGVGGREGVRGLSFSHMKISRKQEAGC